MFGELFSIIAPVLVCAGIGFAWARLGGAYDTNLVTALITNIGAPSLVLSILIEVDIEPAAFGVMVAASVASFAAAAACAAVVLKVAGLPLRAFLPPLTFPNCGNMGLPLALLAFGQPGLALAIVYFTVSAVSMFTFGTAVFSGAVSPARLVRIPILYAVAAVLLIMITGISPPAWVVDTTRLLGGMTIPLMLITLGVSLSRLRIGGLGRSLALSLLRLAMGFALGVALAAGFGFEGTARGVLILQSSMPVAVFNYLFAQRYNRHPEEVAGMVAISTAVSFLTLPALLWYVL